MKFVTPTIISALNSYLIDEIVMAKPVPTQVILEDAAKWQAENPNESVSVFADRYPGQYGTAREAVAKLRRSDSLKFTIGQRVLTEFGAGEITYFYTFVDGETPMEEQYEWVRGSTNIVEVNLDEGHTWRGPGHGVMMSVDDVSPETEFKREERYIVVKLSDFHTKQDEEAIRGWLQKFWVPTRECVVVEHDWPIYEQVWDMVQRMSEGQKQERDALLAHLKRVEKERHEAEVKATFACGECDRLAAQLELAKQREQALAAHVERLINAGNATDMCTFGETKEVLEWDKVCDETPRISLAHRDADTIASLTFPTMLRKMWSGGEVQQWLNEQAEDMRRQAAGTTCQDEGCPHYNIPHSHGEQHND